MSNRADGFVYFVRRVTGGPIKIGYAASVPNRIQRLQTVVPERLQIIFSIEGDRRAEHWLHCKFAHLCEGGEWFRPEPELLEYIAGLVMKMSSGRKPDRVVFDAHVDTGVVHGPLERTLCGNDARAAILAAHERLREFRTPKREVA